MRKTIIAHTIYGRWKVKATVRKWIAVHRIGDDYWGVTHLASGRRFPGYFHSKKDAIAASKLARRMFPYPLRKKNQHLMPTQNQWLQTLWDAKIAFTK
jgi:hypothetical protein